MKQYKEIIDHHEYDVFDYENESVSRDKICSDRYYKEYCLQLNYDNVIFYHTKNAKGHKDFGPCLKFKDGIEYYYKDGKRHRLDGPAIIYPDGRKEYWINNDHICDSYEDFMDYLFENKIESPLNDIKIIIINNKRFWCNENISEKEFTERYLVASDYAKEKYGENCIIVQDDHNEFKFTITSINEVII